MNLLSCLTALTLSAILIFPPASLVSDMLRHQAEIESHLLFQQNMDRSLELMTRAIQGAGYDASRSQHQLAINPLQIKKEGSSRGSDAILLTQDVPDKLGYDCIGNALMPERTINQQTHQRFYLEPNRQDSRTQKLMCQSVDRQGRLHNAELLNHVRYLRIDWVRVAFAMHQPEISRIPTGLIAITLGVQIPSRQEGQARVIEQTRYVSQRHEAISP